MSNQPYRELAIVEKVEKKTCGFIHPARAKLHKCAKPSWLDRIFRVSDGTLWRCGTCGKVYEFASVSNPRTANITFGEWFLANQEDWKRAGGDLDG